MLLPLAACAPDGSSDVGAWLVFGAVVLVYVGLVAVAVRGAPPQARLRVGATWVLSAVAVTGFAWALAKSGTEVETVLLVVIPVATLTTLVGLGLRRSERAWPYVMAGSVGAVTPVVFIVALLAWLVATDACLWS